MAVFEKVFTHSSSRLYISPFFPVRKQEEEDEHEDNGYDGAENYFKQQQEEVQESSRFYQKIKSEVTEYTDAQIHYKPGNALRIYVRADFKLCSFRSNDIDKKRTKISYEQAGSGMHSG